jgi:hypothetical protein
MGKLMIFSIMPPTQTLFIFSWSMGVLTSSGSVKKSRLQDHTFTYTPKDPDTLLASPVPVQPGWMIGVYLTSNGAIPFDFISSDGSQVVYRYNSSLPTDGSLFSYEGYSNRIYSFAAIVVPDTTTSGETVDVTIVKYLNGSHVNAVSAGGNSFPLFATWGDPNDPTNPTSGDSAYFDLGPDGVNTVTPYEAKSQVMPIGSFYSVAEDTSQGVVRASCDDQFPFSRLVGYTLGESLDAAKMAIPTPGAPSLTNIVSNKYVIVWNETCNYAKVTVVKYLDGKKADATATSAQFPMKASWSDAANGSGSATFNLGLAGVNTVNPYEAQSLEMTSGASYSVEEVTSDTSTSTVGTTCTSGQFSRLLGYTTGDTLQQAIDAKTTNLSTTAPNLTNITGNKYVIVWNETCKPVNVTVVKYLDGKHADATSAQSNSFPMNASWSAANGSGTATFALGAAGVQTVNSYEAQSLEMTSGASYSVSEDTSTSAVGSSCSAGQFSQLLGYTTGDTLDKAITAARTTTAPALTNITSNQYVIVWNETCQAVPPDDDDDCDYDDNGHHYGNDKGDNHKSKDKCKHDDNGHHYGNDKGDNHDSPKDSGRDKKDKDGGKR